MELRLGKNLSSGTQEEVVEKVVTLSGHKLILTSIRLKS
jgi:hypothetical protein